MLSQHLNVHLSVHCICSHSKSCNGDSGGVMVVMVIIGVTKAVSSCESKAFVFNKYQQWNFSNFWTILHARDILE